MAANDFPKMLFRKSSNPKAPEIWDLGRFDTCVVADQAEQDKLTSDGWFGHPEDAATAPEKPAKKA